MVTAEPFTLEVRVSSVREMLMPGVPVKARNHGWAHYPPPHRAFHVGYPARQQRIDDLAVRCVYARSGAAPVDEYVASAHDQYGQATVPADLGSVTQVSAGGSFTCAITVDGALRCWGANFSGQAMAPADLTNVIQVSAAVSNACTVTAAGTLHCWGNDASGEATTPADLENVAQVSVGLHHACALTADGVVHCWGENMFGQATVPCDLGAVREISAGHFHTCAVITDGTVRCWGADIFGQTTVPRNPLGVLTMPNDSACPVNDDCILPYPVEPGQPPLLPIFLPLVQR